MKSESSITIIIGRLLQRSHPPQFFSDDDARENTVAVTVANPLNSTATPMKSSSSQLESLPLDTTSQILSYLFPHELFRVALISKRGCDMFHCDLLWKSKFISRWNCLPDYYDYDSATKHNNIGFWKNCFINAHTNPHDLWIRHWNCVAPEDVTTGVGRTVVPVPACDDGNNCSLKLFLGDDDNENMRSGRISRQQQEQQRNIIQFQKQFDSPILKYCPTCRYHPTLHPHGYSNVNEAVEAELNYFHVKQSSDNEDPVETAEIVASAHALLCNSPPNPLETILESTVSKTIHYATQYSVAKWCRNLRCLCRDNNCHCSSIRSNSRSDDSNNNLAGGGHSLTLLDRYSNNCNSNKSMNRAQSVHKKQATHAFECASTYNRKIRTNQYRSSGIQFLSDALFFNIHSSRTTSHQKETMKKMMKQLLHDLGSGIYWNNDGCSPTTNSIESNNDSPPRPSSLPISELGTDFETSYHTWHVIRLTNPEFILPITFRAYIQNPDAFTIYPSEGYLHPGETIYLTLGVRMKASMMNEALERLDVEREEVDPEMARLYATEGHLPFVPFAIRYMYAPPVPVIPPDYRGNNHNNTPPFGPMTQLQTNQESVLDHLWENVKSEADVRTIYISAHVNNNYVFEEFQHATLLPFNITTEQVDCVGAPLATPLTTNMPQILHKSSELFSVIQNLDKETEHSISGDFYRTEKKCLLCKRDWGPQSELLGRAYLLRRLECQKHALLREQELSDFESSLQMIPSLLRRLLLSEDDINDISSSQILGLNRICQLLYCMHREHILPMKARRLVSREERQWYSDCESYIDKTYADIQQILAESLSRETSYILEMHQQQWKRRAVYETSKCTERVDSGAVRATLMYKSEPEYLQNLGSLDYNPFGKANLGVQDDPNHCSSVSMHTDMFKNDALKSFVVAQLMMGNPKVLIGHGVFDRVEKPGLIIRCPSFPVDAYFRPRCLERHCKQREVSVKLDKWASMATISGWKPKNPSSLSQQKYFRFKSINFEFNEQDPDGLSLIIFGQQNFQINFQTTMAHYTSNVPLPGQGKLFLLASPQVKESDSFCNCISVLYTKVQPYSNILHPSMVTEDTLEEENQSQHGQVPVNRNQQIEAVLAMNVIMLIAMHLGWTIDDNYRGGFLLVDRRLLIAAQWFSNTIMTASLLASLLSRKILLINPYPVDRRIPIKKYPAELATKPITSQRFLSQDECGVASIILILFYFYIGRLSERQISRGYERALLDSTTGSKQANISLRNRVARYFQWLWDASVPFFIQLWIYNPIRNRISYDDMTKQVVYHRSMDHRERCIFDATSCFKGNHSILSIQTLGVGSYLIGFCCFLLSFMACSPHFSVNCLTTFFCSVAYGMSLTIESMEIVRRTTSSGVLSLAKPRRLNTLVVGFILIGQLVGSSGGILFLAEFIVTTISILLGGAATVTARAVESWITFLCLSSTSLWGFLSARLGLLDGMRKKRRGFPSNILCASLCSGVAMWIAVLTDGGWNDISPGEVIVAILRGQSQQLLSSVRQWYYSH